jgi:hypothetical protein
MPELVVMGAMTKCSFGLAPSSLMVLPVNRTMCGGVPAANIMDSVPDENILPFGMCISMANPEVAAATAAALGVLVPMPCEPMTPEPWAPGSPTVLVAKMPALTNTCMLTCMWGGEISILVPGQFQAMAP